MAMPTSKTARMVTIAVNVIRAWRTAGSRNAATPLLTASTPVMAVQPLANALAKIHQLTISTPGFMVGGATTDTGCPPDTSVLTIPTATTPSSETTNRYVGMANAKPDSRTPRKFTAAIAASAIRHRLSVYG
jgi:hypothetical protein